jgi:hypothetical protein
MKRFSTLLALLAVFCAPMMVHADTDTVTGVWNISGKVEGFPVLVRCDFERQGDHVGGTCHDGDTGDAHQISMGSVRGDTVTWSYKRRFLLAMFEPRYHGHIEGDSMTGDISVAGHNGAFTADRQ